MDPELVGGGDDFFELYGCPAPQGNSGSPILNEEDEIIGVLSSGGAEMSIVPSTGLVEKYSHDQFYEDSKADLSDPARTPRFSLSGTSAKCILQGAGCDRLITPANKDAAFQNEQIATTARVKGILGEIGSKISAVVPGSPFLEEAEMQSQDSVGKSVIEMTSKISCPHAPYFLDLQKRLGFAGKDFEAKVPYQSRKWVVTLAIGSDWKRETKVSVASGIPVRTLSVKVSRQPDNSYHVFELLAGGQARDLGGLCIP